MGHPYGIAISARAVGSGHIVGMEFIPSCIDGIYSVHIIGTHCIDGIYSVRKLQDLIFNYFLNHRSLLRYYFNQI